MPALTHTFATSTTPERFLAALHTAEGLNGWWAKDGDIGETGHTLRFNKGGNVVSMVFRVDEATGDRVRWTCTDNANPVWPGTTLTWTRAEGGIEFEHAGFAEDKSPPFQMTADGWQHVHNSLAAYLSTGVGQPW